MGQGKFSVRNKGEKNRNRKDKQKKMMRKGS